jgi:zinc transporter ZupT
MIALGLVMLTAGLATLFAMVIQSLPASFGVALLAYAASFSGVLLAGFAFAARRLRRGPTHAHPTTAGRIAGRTRWN